MQRDAERLGQRRRRYLRIISCTISVVNVFAIQDARSSGRLSEANGLIDYTLKFHPQYVSAWEERANIREAEGDIKGAFFCIQKALSLDPDDKGARERYAELEAELHK